MGGKLVNETMPIYFKEKSHQSSHKLTLRLLAVTFSTFNHKDWTEEI